MARDSFIQAAFEGVVKNAKQPTGYYVSLVEEVPYYGGPEEGGWWGSDTHIVAYQWYETEEAATAAKEAVDKLAEELANESRREFGQQCLREMDWLNARGLDADFLPEVDGESRYYVLMTTGLPEESRGCRHYE